MLALSASSAGCLAQSDEAPAEDIAAAESALTGPEIVDQAAPTFNGSGQPWGNAPMAQVFTQNNTGYLTRFQILMQPCYAAWNKPCGFTLELRPVGANGNPTEQVLWSGRGQQPGQADPGWAFGWSTTFFDNGPLLQAGVTYALVVRVDWVGQFVFGDGNPGYRVQWYPEYGAWIRGNGSPDVMIQTVIAPLLAAASCAEVKAANPAAGDGEYTLSVGGRSILVHCANMAGTPADYLTLLRSGGGANVSAYGPGQNSPGLTSAYSKVRFHPDTLSIDWHDTTFAASQGWAQFGQGYAYTVGLGEAADCAGGFSQGGTANVDLRGTPFAVAASQFVTDGWQAAGSASYSAANQVVSLTGGGYCGWTAPTTSSLQLTWRDASLPASCAEVRARDAGAQDGEYTLELAGRPVVIYCHDLAGTPANYLTLKNVGPSANFSQYTAGGPVALGTNVRTHYTKVRIDPASLLLNVSDQTFASSSGQLDHAGTTVTSMPFAVAMSCDGTASGAGNIDLTGTGFAVAPNEFVHIGAQSGSASYSSGNKVVDLAGGGWCGWTAPGPNTGNPFNQAGGGFTLGLVHAP
jgi:hypothetical protein